MLSPRLVIYAPAASDREAHLHGRPKSAAVRSHFRAASAAVSILSLCACSSSIGGVFRQTAVPPSTAVRGNVQASTTGGVLYVDDRRIAVDLLANRRWKKRGSITTGIDGPAQNWVDAGGNLYVANTENVVEYAPGSQSPSFTYSNAIQSAVDVTTDSGGNVYVADSSAERVAEFAANSNTIVASCYPAEAEITGVAVDGSGDVFVAYFISSGHIVEYRGGLSGCHATVLKVSLGYPAGMALDEHANLVVCDGRGVDIVKPPYMLVSGTLGRGYQSPVSVRINKRNDEAYVADFGLREVFVLRYPAGSIIKKLGSKNGIYDPTGAVDSENFNP